MAHNLRVERDYPPAPWLTPAIRKRLGAVPDRVIANEVSRHRSSVRQARVRLGISGYRAEPWLTDAVIDRLGQDSDAAIAADLSVSDDSVSRARRRLGIPARDRGKRSTKQPFVRREDSWLSPGVRKRLGTVPDRVIAEKAGITTRAVQKARSELGIEPWKKPARTWLTADIEARLGTVQDRVIAEEVGVTVNAVKTTRRNLGIKAKGRIPHAEPQFGPWLTPELKARMGTVPDRVLAAEVGMCKGQVAVARRHFGIPSVLKRGRPWLTDEIRALLGTVPDSVVAKQVDRTNGAVAFARNKLGIPPFNVKFRSRSRQHPDREGLEAQVLELLRTRPGLTTSGLSRLLGVPLDVLAAVIAVSEGIGRDGDGADSGWLAR